MFPCPDLLYVSFKHVFLINVSSCLDVPNTKVLNKTSNLNESYALLNSANDWCTAHFISDLSEVFENWRIADQ